MNKTGEKILIITTQGVGNTILSLPLLKALQKQGCLIDMVLSDNGSSELVSILTPVSKIYLWKEKDSVFSNLFRILPELVRKRYDAAFALCPAGKRENVLLRLSRAALKRGWRTNDQKRLFSFQNNAMPFWDEHKHDLESNRELLGLEKERIDEEIRVFNRTYAKNFPYQKGAKLRLGIQALTKNRAKCWDLSRYKILISRLAGEFDLKTVFFTITPDKELLEDLTREVPAPSEILTGASWPQIISKMKDLDLFIGVDSSLAHLSGLLGVKTAVLFSYTPPERVSPLGSNVTAIQTNYPCCPCYRFASGYIESCDYNLRCIKELTAEEVSDVIFAILKNSARDFSEHLAGNKYSVTELSFSAKQVAVLR